MDCPLVYVRLFLLIIFLLSLALMAYDLYVELTEALIFYFITHGVLLFRLCGVQFISKIIHILAFTALEVYFILLVTFFEDSTFQPSAYWLLVFCTCIWITALHCVFVLRGGTYLDKAKRAGNHALFGLMLVVISFWVCCGTCSGTTLQILAEILYLFLFLFMVLTPHFQTSTHAANMAKYGPPKTNACPVDEDDA